MTKKNRGMRIFFLLLISSVLFFQASAKREQGSWQDYLSYNNATKVTTSGTKVFCATEGGIFYYDLEDNSVSMLESSIAVSDFGVETIAYSLENKVLVVAYTNSNIDLVYTDGSVVNLSDIKRKTISGSKAINNIAFKGSEAYLSCGFGIVVLNLEKKEVKDTYYIAQGGLPIVVNDIEIYEQYIYAATNEGIYKASADGVNLQNYSNWSRVTNISHAQDKFNNLVEHSGSLIANYTPDEWSQDEMYILNNGEWKSYLPSIKYASDMQSAEGYLTIASRSAVYVIDSDQTLIGTIGAYNFSEETVSGIKPNSAVVTPDGAIWISDRTDVLVRVKDEAFERILPEGPVDNSVFALGQISSGLWVAPGGLTGYTTPYFQKYENGEWKYFSSRTNAELSGFHNILSLAVDPSNENHFFVASWGGGLLEYLNDEFVTRYYNLNSPLESALPQQPNEPYTRIGGMAFDDQGNLWMTNAECSHNLHKLTPEGEWESFELPSAANRYNPLDIIVNKNGDKWILVSEHDAYVVNESGSEIKQLLVTSYFNNGTDEIYTRMNDVHAIAEDEEGAIWIGTSAGIAVYSSPSRIWTSDYFYAAQPGLDLDDGIYHPLLETETVTAIAVDGANRKWVGTKSSGVFLISESGEAEILHFTVDNSALLSNTITDITINQKSGEVFFGTEKGLISYQGEATSGSSTYSDVYVYPNPVRETYDGPVTIAGLIANTDIKITDITGNLVYTTTSLGGQAVWDGKNLNGNRVKTGVYLVFCNDENGEETHITKLLFIH